MTKLEKRVQDLLKSEPFTSFKAKDIQRILQIPQNKYQKLRSALRSLVQHNDIAKVKKNRYTASTAGNEVTGGLRVNSQGYGFVSLEKGEDIFISQKNMGLALHKDKVRVRLFASTSGRLQEGKVVEVLERDRDTLVGTFRWGRKYGYIIPDEIKIQRDVVIPPGDEKGAQEGQKVVCRIVEWEHYGMNPAGEIIEVLGYPTEPGVDIQSLIYDHQLPLKFPDAVINQAEAISPDIPQKEIDRRMDLRDWDLFTIDPVDAKDFDDAVSLKTLPNGNQLLGVHIADVSHYVPPNSALDREALKRGNSVYLVDRVIPMLPEHLSNGVCSLQEKIDKLAFSVLMELNGNAQVIKYDIRESVINSSKRFAYEEVQAILDEKMKNEYHDTLHQMLALSKQLIKKRKQRGSIDFESTDVQVELDDKGHPVGIHKRERQDANRLIEEFMLLANQTIAKHVGIMLRKQLHVDLPFIYRIHDKPEHEDVLELVQIAQAFDFNVMVPNKITPRFFQQLANDFSKHPASSVLHDALLRTMTKAKYQPEDHGHFGLAYKHYTHFTSPIRRYADLVVHRLLKAYNLMQDPGEAPMQLKSLEKICTKITNLEIKAQEAERDSIKMKQIEFLLPKEGEVFEGVISRIMNFGFFVQLTDYLIDGLVHVTSLEDDYYIYDDKNYVLYGQHSGRKFRLGEVVKVKLVRVDINEQLIDFEIEE